MQDVSHFYIQQIWVCSDKIKCNERLTDHLSVVIVFPIAAQ